MSERPGAAFGQLVQRWRLVAGMTQQELADRSSLSVRGISDVERGLKRRPRPHTVRMLADALDLPVEERAAFFVSAGAGPIARGFSLGRVAPRVTARPPVPRPSGPLLGREEETRIILDRLRDPGTRVVTLAGPTGSGRTRVMLEIAHLAAAAFRDGVALAPMRAVHGAEAIASDIAFAFGLRALDDAEPVEALAGALDGLAALLLLDDLDPSVVSASGIGALLERCPALRVVATSEQPLGIPGERVVGIGPLPFFAADAADSDPRAADAPAVRYFRTLWHADEDDPAASPRSAAAVRSAAGMPLAIELSAARRGGPAILPAEPGALLPDSADGPAHAMRRVAAACIDALSPAEQLALARCSVFRGGFTLEAAHAVAAGPGDSPGRMLELAESLAEARMLTRTPGPDGMRHEIPAAVAREAASRLAAAGETDAMRRRHAAWIIDAADRLQHRIFFPPVPHDLGQDAFDAELANIRAAMEWLIARGASEDGIRLIGASWFPLSLRGRSREAFDWALRLAPPPFPDPGAPLLDPMGPIGTGWLASLAGSGDIGEAYARFGLARARAVAPDLAPLAVTVVSFSLSAQRRRADAIAAAEDAVEMASEAPASRWLGIASNRLGVARENDGDAAGAIPHLKRALAVWRGHAFRWGMATAKNNLADALFQTGALPNAALLHRGVIVDALAGAMPSDPWVVLRSWQGLAEIALAAGDLRRAALMLGAGERYRVEHGFVLPADERAVRLAAEWRMRAEAGPSATAGWLAEGRAMSVDEALAAADGLLGDLEP